MNYQEKVATRADVRALYEKVVADPTIARYRGYTATKSYGWNAAAEDYFKRDGEVWFENPAYDADYVAEGSVQSRDELLDEQLEQNARRIEALCTEKSELCLLIDTLNERIAAYERELAKVTDERDEARRALAALREALEGIRRLTEAVA